MPDVFKGLADPTRREILSLLKDRDLNVGEIAKHFPISMASLSHHLNILYEARLVTKIKKGQFVYYSLNTTIVEDVILKLVSLQKKEE
ncbi:autorepressor SdpR family transcription factor [Lysinibacillus halotolerans]|uniref:Winged helix-turn-helix transcriptional regulator n=1 Tax=Ureibacillus galli TaxID=2762222 RepID=A0ABR8XE60_9BACL|nr:MULTISPECIES: autorepressor SdpR family transcription factor [Bacillales]MBD8027521.1 winged helix-turn-helix transcriptional regulator [Ureibacillus galli]